MSVETITYRSAPSDERSEQKYFEQQSFNYTYKQTYQPKQLQKHNSEASSFIQLNTSKSQTKKENISQKKNDQSNFFDFQHQIIKEKQVHKKSVLQDLLKKRINSRRTQITVYFFNSDRKLNFHKTQISKLFEGPDNQNVRTVKNLIPILVRSYCRLFLSFQPQQVNHQSFQLKLADFNNKDDPILDCIDIDENISYLYDAGNLLLVRKKRSKQRLLTWQKNIHEEKPDVDILEIIIPHQRQLVQKIQSFKTINHLKEKNSAIHQLGKIVILQYTTFKVCDGKTKISEIPEKVLQVFRQKQMTYDDKPQKKIVKAQLKQDKCSNQAFSQCQTEDKRIQILMKRRFLKNFYLIIDGPSIIQKYDGGLLSQFFNFSNKQRSIHNLVGLSSNSTLITLKFKYKDHDEMVQYQFKENIDRKQQFMRRLIKLGRRYDKNFTRM